MFGVMHDVTPEFWVKNHEQCNTTLKTLWDKVPLLGVDPDHLFREGQLVRFQGMVQDMDNPVFFMEECEVKNTITGHKETRCGKFRETIVCQENETLLCEMGNQVTKERRPYYCISIPGLNEWACPKTTFVGESPENSAPTQQKRSAEEMEVETAVLSEPVANKKVCDNKRTETKEAAKVMELHFPIPGPKNRACLVNLYDVEDGSVKVNEVIDAVGFLWYPTNDVSSDDEEGGYSLPSSLLPRLHAVSYKTIRSSNPLYTFYSSTKFLENAASLRGDLHLTLTQLLLGDSLAADYLICNLVSTIFLRQDILPVGKFSVNISNVPSTHNYAEQVYNVISRLVVKSHYLPISLNSMNSLELLPVKDYDSNRLKSGVLQLSDNTHLVLDETKLEVGKLEEKGVRNMRTLNDLILHQRLNYDFKYYGMEFPTDIPVLTLSEGKSLLESDIHVILEPVESYTSSFDENYEAVGQYLKDPLLTQLRTYITAATYANFQLPDELMDTVQNDFVTMRRNPDLKMSADGLHALLVLARLMCLSHGCEILTKEMWTRSMEMEITRRMRISKKTQTN